MANKPTSRKGPWWNHETDPTELEELSTAFTALQREQHAAGWRRNALIVLCAVAIVAAFKLLAA